MRRKRIAALTAVLTTVTGLAFAAFVTDYLFEGSGSNTTTKGSAAVLPASVAFNSGLFPGEGKQLNITLNNTTGKVLHARKIEWATTDSNEPACPGSTFFVEGASNEDKELEAGKGGAEIKAGTNSNWTPPEGGYLVRMKDTGKEDQSACEAVTVTVKVKLHASGE